MNQTGLLKIFSHRSHQWEGQEGRKDRVNPCINYTQQRVSVDEEERQKKQRQKGHKQRQLREENCRIDSNSGRETSP